MDKRRTLTAGEKKLWLQILQEARKIRSVLPLAHWKSSDWFAVWPSAASEPYFICLFELDEEPGKLIRFFKGFQALSDFVKLQDRKQPPVPLWMLEIPMFELFLTNGAKALPCAKPLLLELGLTVPGKKDPHEEIHHIGPGLHPWNPTREELPIVYDLLHQLLEILLRGEKGDKELLPQEPMEIFCRKQDEAGQWNDSFVVAKSFEMPGVEISLKNDVITRLRKLPTSPMPVQLEMTQILFPLGFILPIRICENAQISYSEIPECPESVYLLLAVDKKTGKFYHSHALSAASGVRKLWERVPLLLLRLFEEMGGLPESIEVSGTRLKNLLKAMALPQTFRLTYRKELKHVERVMPDLLTKLVTGSL